MSERVEAKGQCLCGGVQVHAPSMSQKMGACHCSTCRRWGGGPLMVVDCGTEVTFSGQAHISVYDSSEWAERGFCERCGSHLFYRLKQNSQHLMAAGLFDGVELDFDHQVFIDEKPNYYCFSNQTQNMTGAEVFAMFAPPSSP